MGCKMRLIDADELVETLERLAEDERNQRDRTNWSDAFEAFKTLVETTPSVTPITAMYYYYEERDREYAERMDDIWKNM